MGVPLAAAVPAAAANPAAPSPVVSSALPTPVASSPVASPVVSSPVAPGPVGSSTAGSSTAGSSTEPAAHPTGSPAAAGTGPARAGATRPGTARAGAKATSSAPKAVRRAATTTLPGGYQALTPTRLLDTRSGLGAPKAALAGYGTLSVQVAGLAAVPSTGVAAVVVNVTVISPSKDGYLTVYGHGGNRPGASNLDFHPGRNSANLTVSRLGSGGLLDLFNGSPGSIQLVADIAGYYLAGPATDPGSFTPVTTARLLDTRTGLGAAKAAVPAQGTISLQVAGLAGVPSTGVAAVVLNVTVISPTKDGYLTVYGHGAGRPGASNLDFHPGLSVANLTVTGLGGTGQLDLFNGSPGTVQLVADIAGYYLAGTPSQAGAFSSIAPERLLDTRTGLGAPKAALPGGTTVALQLTGRPGIPSTGVAAVALNVTAISPSTSGYLTGYPSGTPLAAVSNLDFAANSSVANLMVVPVGSDGAVYLRNGGTGTVQLVADVAGYYLGDPAPASTSAITGRVTDTAGRPLANVVIDAYGQGVQNDDPRTVSDATGHYLITGIASDRSVICFQPDVPGHPATTGGSSTTGYSYGCLSDEPDLSPGVTATVADMQLATAGAITGKVTDAAGHPLNGIVVETATNGSGVLPSGITTAADGSYRIADLGTDPLTVCFDARTRTDLTPGGFVHQCYNHLDAPYNQPYRQDATPIAVQSGKTIANINGRLTAGAAATGRVTDPAGHPVAGIVVDAYPSSGYFTTTTSKADGSYLLSGLAAGEYSVCFFPYASSDAPVSARGYTSQCYHQSYPFATANLALAAGTVSKAINASLNNGGSLQVTVSDATGHPIPNVTVTVDNRVLSTSAAGTARFDKLEVGNHRVCFDASGVTTANVPAGFFNDCYLHRSDSTSATPVAVTAGKLTSISEALATAGGVAVTVTDPQGRPISGVGGSVNGRGGQPSDAAGKLVIPDLSTGSYPLCIDANGTDGRGAGVGGASPGGYRGRCGLAGDDPQVNVTVQTGQLTTVTVQLTPLGALGGIVTDPHGHPLQNVAVTVSRLDGFYQPDFFVTGADGRYLDRRLTSAPYSVCFTASGNPYSGQPVSGGDSSTGYVDECYDQVTSGSPSSITVTDGNLATADAALAYGGVIAGKVTDSSGTPIANASVSASVNGYAGGSTLTATDGSYRIDSLTPGNYQVCAGAYQVPSTHGYFFENQCYLHASSIDDATPVPVTGAATSTIDFQLVEDGGLSGTMTDDLGTPLPNEQVVISTAGNVVGYASTDADGAWSQPNLTPGSYTVCFQTFYYQGPNPNGYQDQCYDRIAPGGTPTPITVSSGQNHSGINAQLARLGGVRGTVTDGQGQPISIQVQLMQGASVIETAYADYTGGYDFNQVPAGTYSVFFPGSSYGFQDRYYHDVTPDGTPTPVTVRAGQDTTGIDQSLATTTG
ncbi:MAG: carboxypeptidase regulatory-like domain-containing protein [Jatrophihabitans sp.]